MNSCRVSGVYVTKHATAVSVSNFGREFVMRYCLSISGARDTKINRRSHYCNWKSNRREVAMAKKKNGSFEKYLEVFVVRQPTNIWRNKAME